MDRTADVTVTANGVSLDVARPLRILGTRHVVAESPGRRVATRTRVFRLLIVLQGHVSVTIGNSALAASGAEAIFLQPGDSAELLLRHSVASEYYLFEFRPPSREGATLREITLADRLYVSNVPRIVSLLRLFDERTSRRRSELCILRHTLALLLFELSRATTNAPEARDFEGGREVMASRVDAYIAAHYHEMIRTSDIASDLHFNPQYLERSYRAERGMSIRDAIHARRIHEARAQLLIQKTAKIDRIAKLCGYQDTAYFRRVFKRVTKTTPKRFRTVSERNRV